MNIEVAGITLGLHIENSELYDAALDRYKGFLSRSRPVLDLDIENVKIERKEGKQIKTEVVLSGDIISIKHNNFLSKIDIILKKGKVFTGDNIYHLDSFLRVLYSSLIIMKNGMLLHACGISKKNNGAAFSGLSSSGKTTIARLFPEGRILSDEIVALRKSGRKWYAYSTPFWGEMKAGGRAVRKELKAVYLLKRGKDFQIEKLSRKDAMGILLRNLLFFLKGKGDVCLEVADKLLKTIPVYNFSFSPSHIDRGNIDELIG